MSTDRTRSILLACLLTAFLDLVGFSIIFPLFPQMLEHYLALEGPDSLLGRAVAWLSTWAGGRHNAGFLVTVLFGGVLGSIYSLLQFLFAPVWGAYSDRAGRRTALLITLAGTMLSYVGWFFAGSFAMLVIARLIGGAMAGNLATVTAAVADATDEKNRSRGMGMIGAAIGLGFIIGPAIGGISSLYDLSAAFPQLVPYGVNPFSLPALLAFVLSVVNFAVAWRRFPETRPKEKRAERTVYRSANPLAPFIRLNQPGVKRVNAISFLYLTAFASMEFTLVFLTVERFGYTPRNNAGMFVFIGVMVALVQGGALRRLGPRYGDRRLARVGLALLIPGFLLVGYATGQPMVYAGLAFMATGSGLAMPTLGALASKYAPEDQQGLALGLFRSMGALSRALGPILGGLLYWRFGSSAPYAAGAVFVLIPFALALTLPAPSR